MHTDRDGHWIYRMEYGIRSQDSTSCNLFTFNSTQYTTRKLRNLSTGECTVSVIQKAYLPQNDFLICLTENLKNEHSNSNPWIQCYIAKGTSHQQELECPDVSVKCQLLKMQKGMGRQIFYRWCTQDSLKIPSKKLNFRQCLTSAIYGSTSISIVPGLAKLYSIKLQYNSIFTN